MATGHASVGLRERVAAAATNTWKDSSQTSDYRTEIGSYNVCLVGMAQSVPVEKGRTCASGAEPDLGIGFRRLASFG